jgi:Na+/H+ antiporter NhaD/arsenite permease-like protein
LIGVVAAVALIVPGKPLPGPLATIAPQGFVVFPFLREIVMLVLVGLSLATTPRGAREANRFSYFAIIEVAVLFIGIFIAMQVPVEVLKAKGDTLGLEAPWHFFWATGTLSAFLDNAPTYVVFFQVADTLTQAPGPGVLTLADGSFMRADLLTGVSLGAVFMGAMTYIGNGPNFMVKSIAEQSGIRMPSFFGFMLKYSLPVLTPVFVIITIAFLR